jgi:hypothetical protein
VSASGAPTVLTVVGGETPAPTLSFPPGNPVSGLSVGAKSDWVIVASGVEPVHLYLAFDGREVHVAPAAPTARVFLNGRELGAGWHAAPVGCELRFGAVCLLVTNEAARGGTQPLGPLNKPSEPAQPGRQVHTQIMGLTAPAPATPAAAGRSEPPPHAEGARPPMAGFAPVQAAPHVQGPWASQAVQQGGGPFPAPVDQLRSTAQWHTPPGAMQSRGASSAPPEKREEQAPPPVNIPKIQPAPMVPLGRLDRTLASPATPAQVTAPPAVAVVAAAAPPMPVLAPAVAPPPAPGAPGAARSDSAGGEGNLLGPNTVGDGGALRAHAERVAEATPSAALTLAQEYAEEVRRASGATPVPAAGRPAAASNIRPGPPEVPAPEAPRVAPRFSLRSSWREASIVKKLTLVLLPFGLVGVALMPDEQPAPAPAPVKKVASARPSAPVPAASSALAPGASGSPPSTVLSVARPAASAPPLAGPASSVGASIIEVGSAAASSAAATRPLYPAAERDAINAAFEGRNADAARLYERLSSAQRGPVFALAAHLVRENIVLKPAISH